VSFIADVAARSFLLLSSLAEVEVVSEDLRFRPSSSPAGLSLRHFFFFLMRWLLCAVLWVLPDGAPNRRRPDDFGSFFFPHDAPRILTFSLRVLRASLLSFFFLCHVKRAFRSPPPLLFVFFFPSSFARPGNISSVFFLPFPLPADRGKQPQSASCISANFPFFFLI